MALSIERLADHLRSIDNLEPPSGDGRTVAVRRLVGQARRRRVTVGVLGAAVVLAAAAGVATLARSTESVTQLAAEHGLAISLRQPDGVIYRIAAVLTMDTGEEQSVTTHIAAPYGMITVAAACDSSGVHNTAEPDDVTAISPGVASATPIFCSPHIGPTDLEVGPPGADGRATVTITNQDMSRPAVAIWTFGIYTWQLPPKLTPPTPLPDLPATLDGYTLRRTVSGTLATQRSVNVQVPGGTSWEAVALCGPALRDATESFSSWQVDQEEIGVPGQVVISIDGRPQEGQSCNVVASAGDLAALSANQALARLVPPGANDATITFEFPQAYDLRAANWALGIYESN